MLIVERQEKLLEILRSRKAAQLEDLSRELGVSASTVRRDLEVLEEQGLVERLHGGAVYRGPVAETPIKAGQNAPLRERLAEHAEAKLAIGRYAASLVQPQMTVLLDGGSTVIFAARLITARPIQIVTNSLSVANLFLEDDQVELVLVGGNVYPRTESTIGPIASGSLADLHADLLLFSLAGIFGDEAFNVNLAMAQVEQAMMRQAARSVLLMDASKFGRKSLARVCALGEVDQIVCDSGLDQSWRQQLGERLVIAP
jgi:DeoR/GlpR family transcriptional regulator of sugar metabolism